MTVVRSYNSLQNKEDQGVFNSAMISIQPCTPLNHYNNHQIDEDPVHLGDIKTKMSYDDLEKKIQVIIEERIVLSEKIQVLEEKLDIHFHENRPSFQSDKSALTIQSEEKPILCCRRSHLRFIPPPYSNIPLLSMFLIFIGLTLYLISVAFHRLHKEVNTSFSTEALNVFPSFNIMICPMLPGEEIVVYAQRSGNETTNPFYSIFNSDINDTRSIYFRKGDPNKLIGGYIPDSNCHYIHSFIPLYKNESYLGFDFDCERHPDDPTCFSASSFALWIISPSNSGILYSITSVDSDLLEPRALYSIPSNSSEMIIIRLSSTAMYTYKPKINPWKLLKFEMNSVYGPSVDTDAQSVMDTKDIYDVKYSFTLYPSIVHVFSNPDVIYNQMVFAPTACDWQQTVVTETYAFGYYDLIQSIVTYLAFFGTFAFGSMSFIPSSLEYFTRLSLQLRRGPK